MQDDSEVCVTALETSLGTFRPTVRKDLTQVDLLLFD